MINKPEKVKAKKQQNNAGVTKNIEELKKKAKQKNKQLEAKKNVEKPAQKEEIKQKVDKKIQQTNSVKKKEDQEEKMEVKKVEKQKNKEKNGKKETEDKKMDTTPSVEQTTPVKNKAADACTLFLKSLPNDVTEDEIRSLSSEIQEVRIKRSRKNMNSKNKKAGKQFTFAHIEFDSEEIANKNYKEFQHKKIRDKQLIVDFVGEKSSYVKKEVKDKEKQKEKDLLKLHISGFDRNVAEADLKKFFKNCTEFSLPIKKDTKMNFGFAFVSFSNQQDAKKALDAVNGKELNGKKLAIDYAFKKPEPKVKQEAVVKAEEPANKKLKNTKGEQQVVKKQDEKKKEVPATKMNGKVKQEEIKNGKRKLEEDEDEDDEEDEDEDDEDEDDEEDEEDDDEDDDEEDEDEDDEDEDDEEDEDDGDEEDEDDDDEEDEDDDDEEDEDEDDDE